ncbi:rhodanese-like domain-containing protein [Propionigenium maris]|nr:rhodanese-like domain-containing protein [Propionigenium maris]
MEKEKAMELIGETDIVVLDVRTPDEIAKVESLVEDAVNINFYENFEEEVDKLNREDDYLVVCSGGIRSRKACSIMEEKGFKTLYSLKGGMDSFKECNT